MTRRIHILPDRVANQIAAGEVVERPASVVKELVENALDAGSGRIEVSLRGGGKTEIRVADDGSGMGREDALLALDRHATSKIREAEDLHRVSSFGFRGEALPSIAAVSRFELETAAAGGGAGTRIRVRNGRIGSVDDVARRAGTTVTVRALFGDLPARAKFLKSASAETRACSEAVVLLALANLPVAFRLESNGRLLLDLPSAGSLRARAADLWGEEAAGEFLEVDRSTGGIRVGGLIQRPEAAGRGTSRRYLFVNGRPFRSAALHRMVDEAYRTTVPGQVRPAFLLYLSVEPRDVDVNVHPAKAEVRFRDRPAVEAAVRSAVRAGLGGLESAAPARPGGVGTTATAAPVREGAPSVVREREPGAGAGEEPTVDGPADARPAPSQLALFVPGGAESGEDRTLSAQDVSGVPALRRRPLLWQLHDRYILASVRDGLLLIDQHSAHERVLFEEIMRRFEQGKGASQRLLFPVTLRLGPDEYAAVEELAGLLRQTGFEIEPFGDRTVIIHAGPQPHPGFDAEGCFRAMIDELTHGSPLVDSARNQHERIAKSLACKGAIKAGQPLDFDEMAELVDRLFATELPGHDVHGRPTILRLTLEELERRFGRT
jgi:DNA mismatch repair protein MutL